MRWFDDENPKRNRSGSMVSATVQLLLRNTFPALFGEPESRSPHIPALMMSSPTGSPDFHSSHVLLCASESRTTHPPDYSSTFPTFSDPPPPATSEQVLPNGTASPRCSHRHLSLSISPDAVSPKLEEEDNFLGNTGSPGVMVHEPVSTNSMHSRFTLIGV